MSPEAGNRMPALFIEHGSPLVLEDRAWQADLHRVATELPRPRAILIFSAHWEESGFYLGATRPVPLEYDYFGFPDHYYRVSYAPPGAPDLGDRVAGLTQALGPLQRTDRGLDHGAFIPLMAMYPSADIPVLQMAIPSEDPQALLALGRALAPLRDEGVLLLGGGYLIHNLRLIRPGPDAPTPEWALAFDAWVADALARKDIAALTRYRSEAPHVRLALPTVEHFLPLFIPLGASTDPAEKVSFPLTGFTFGCMTRRSVRWG